MKNVWRSALAAFGIGASLTAGVALAQPPEGEQQAVEEEPVPDAPPSQTLTPPAPAAHERVCDDRRDDDGDGLADCADADCFEVEHCRAGGSDERTDLQCSDWVDNDGDSSVDCEDDDCNAPDITVCRGSFQRPQGADGDPSADQIPELSGDMSVEDLIGRGGDADGERNDYLCSDGIDNDRDGRIDCQDFGCRFDPSVAVCASTPGLRFGIVAGVGASLRIEETPDIDLDGFTEYTDPIGDVRFTRLQLRAFGQIPFIPNSFFLINVRAERTFRLTFANFNIPLGDLGHYLSINSGSGGLSPGLIVSTSKQPLLDPPFYLLNSFEQGAGAALEVGGPITTDNLLRFRVFVSGGSGEFNGNVGGRFFRSEDRNFSYGAGAQFQLNIVGNFDRFDTPFLYVPVPLTVAVLAGGRFDQRPTERYAAWNAFAVFRFWHFLVRAEHYGRYVLDFDAVQTAFNVQLSALIVPRVLMFAADVGGVFLPLEYIGVADDFDQPMEQFQFRAALHWFYFRNIGILSLLYSMTMDCQQVFGATCAAPANDPEAPITTHELRLEAQFRF
jgi:hypothetical protein